MSWLMSKQKQIKTKNSTRFKHVHLRVREDDSWSLRKKIESIKSIKRISFNLGLRCWDRNHMVNIDRVRFPANTRYCIRRSKWLVHSKQLVLLLQANKSKFFFKNFYKEFKIFTFSVGGVSRFVLFEFTRCGQNAFPHVASSYQNRLYQCMLMLCYACRFKTSDRGRNESSDVK